MKSISNKLIRGFIASCYSKRQDRLVEEDDHIVNVLWSLINWSLFLGAIVGSMIVGILSDRFGRFVNNGRLNI